MPRINGPFKVLKRISNNAYQLDLQGKYTVNGSFNVSDLLPYFADNLDLRSNPFQVRENDEPMANTTTAHQPEEQLVPEEAPHKPKEQLVAEKQLVPEKALIFPTGPLTRSRSKRGVETNTLFDSGATHFFVSPEIVKKDGFEIDRNTEYIIVITAGGQLMYQFGIVRDISLVVNGVDMPTNLIIVKLKKHDVSLGVDWLGKYKAHINCHQGRIQFEREEGMLKFQGITTALRSLVISAIQSERMLEKGCEAYIATITTKEVGANAELKDIPIANEFTDVFEAVNGLPPDRSDPFIIELKPGYVLSLKLCTGCHRQKWRS
ncbi:Aspartic peptidase domain superfamily [Arabidopsis suecica]|uniref:Aspartic peptidase domain superfamily n=1 Tax=Arabidopsis suecica TaxID=45249 RepID=A0A8T1XAS2_ARASU|nr:Aspartic peptidase domain superfamily [Arabidopsis suecica]